MREIKFRAWDVHFGEMVGPNYNGDHWIFECDYDGMSLARETDDEVCANYTTVESVFMQYTGLKDKNGVEIYEGDIVDYVRVMSCYNDEERTVIKFKGGAFTHIGLCHNPVVIGNIYESPELIESATE